MQIPPIGSSNSGASPQGGYPVSGDILYLDATNPNETVNFAYAASLGVKQVDIAFVSPSNPQISSEMEALVAQAHEAGLKVYLSVGGSTATTLGNTDAWNVTAADGEALAEAANAAGFDGVDFDYELDDSSPPPNGIPGGSGNVQEFSQQLEGFFSAVSSNLNNKNMSLTVLGWPEHYFNSPTPPFTSGALLNTFQNFNSLFNGLNLMMYDGGEDLDAKDSNGEYYLQEWIQTANSYNIPLSQVHVAFSNFAGTSSKQYPAGSGATEGCNAADTYVNILQDLGYNPTNFGDAVFWPNEGIGGNPINPVLNEINDFNNRVENPSYIPTPPPPTPLTPTANYTVQAGDTFTTIAQEFNTTAGELELWNPNVNPNNLQIGEEITIPPGHAYTVQAGDYFYSIAQKLGTTVAQLEAANPNVDPNNLKIGQVLVLPPSIASGITGAYTIQSGDTFTTIASQFNMSAAELELLNPGVDPSKLQIGQIIAVPGYAIQSGDTLAKIAAKFDTTVAELETLNPNVNPNLLQIGQIINVPGSGT